MPILDTGAYGFIISATQKLWDIPPPTRQESRSIPRGVTSPPDTTRTREERVEGLLRELEKLGRSTASRRQTSADTKLESRTRLLLAALRVTHYFGVSDAQIRPLLEWNDAPDFQSMSRTARSRELIARIRTLMKVWSVGRELRRLPPQERKDVNDGPELQELSLEMLRAAVSVIEGEGVPLLTLRRAMDSLVRQAQEVRQRKS